MSREDGVEAGREGRQGDMGGGTMLGIMRSSPCDAVNVVANAPVLSAP